MSGYFAPILSTVPAGNKPGGKPLQVNVFLGHPGAAADQHAEGICHRVPINDLLPAFWLAAGAQDKPDVVAAANFRQLLQTRVANVPFVVIPGGGHQGSVWRAALGPMLTWMTPQLAQAAKADAAATAAAPAAAARKAHDAKPRTPQPRPCPGSRSPPEGR